MERSKTVQTMVVGSYTVPEWYPALQNSVSSGQLRPQDFEDAKATAACACVKAHEVAGIDLVGDGELFRRDNNRCGPPNAMINYFTAKIPGFSKEIRPKKGVTPVAPDAELPAPVVTGKLIPVDLGLTKELAFIRKYSKQPVKIAVTGPHMFARVVWNEHYPDVKSLAFDMAKVINAEILRLDEAGCDVIQLDEPILWFLQGDQSWGIEAINMCFHGVKKAKKALHLCQGNYNPDPAAHKGIRIFPSKFEDVWPIIAGAHIDIVVMAFSGIGDVSDESLSIFKGLPKDKCLAIGCLDVQSHSIEKPEQVAAVLKRMSKFVPKERLYAAPDCGMNHLPHDIAFGKLRALAEGVALFEAEKH